MKTRNKGKVHPSPTSFAPNKDCLQVLKLLPAAILALISVLSLEDREVVAYMITRSLKSSLILPAKKKKKQSSEYCHGHNSPALFDCDCFHCYTSFWLRWDSSPNRDLIHQAIEAFEDHSNNTANGGKIKTREKMSRRKADKMSPATAGSLLQISAAEKLAGAPLENEVAEADTPPSAPVYIHKGLARKVLPDVMGIFNSRLWRLWSPNV